LSAAFLLGCSICAPVTATAVSAAARHSHYLPCEKTAPGFVYSLNLTDRLASGESSDRSAYVPLKERIKSIIPAHARQDSNLPVEPTDNHAVDKTSEPPRSDEQSVAPAQSAADNQQFLPVAGDSAGSPDDAPDSEDKPLKMLPLKMRIEKLLPEYLREKPLKDDQAIASSSEAVVEYKPEKLPSAPVEEALTPESGFELPTLPLKNRIEAIVPAHARDLFDSLPGLAAYLLAEDKKKDKKSEAAAKAVVATATVAHEEPAVKNDRQRIEVIAGDSALPDDTPNGIFGINSFENGVRITPNTMLEGMPVENGQTVTLSFEVTNNSDQPRNFVEEAVLPEGVTMAFPPAEFSLGPKESFNSLLMLTIPRQLPSGVHNVSFNVFDPDNQSVRGNFSFSFAIKAVTALRFVFEEAPEGAVSGDEFDIIGRIGNTGNATVSARLKPNRSKYLNADFVPAEITLAPGQSEKIIARVSFPENALKASQVTVDFVGESLLPGQPREVLREFVSVKLLPLAEKTIDFRRRIPGSLVTNIYGEGSRYYNQFELSGRGTIDKDGQRIVDFFVRSNKNSDGYSAWSRRDMARFRYKTPEYALRIGEEGFGLSQLSSSGSSSRGFGVDYKINDTSNAGVIRYTSRYRFPVVMGTGFYFDHQFADNLWLRLNHHSYTNTRVIDLRDQRINTVEVRYRPNRLTNINAEFGRSTGGSDFVDSDTAYRVALGTRVARAMINVMLRKPARIMVMDSAAAGILMQE
jgi:hypothetical protein